MAQSILLDVARDPVGIGALLVVVLLVLGFVVFLAVGLVLFLWYRKCSMRRVVMAPHEALPVVGADHVPSNPNH